MKAALIPPAQPSASRRAWRLFAVLTVLPTLLLLVLCPVIVRRPAFGTVGQVQWVQVIDYPFLQKHQDADVVIFGDSSALHGADSLALSHDLRLKVINLSGSVKTLGMLKAAPLDAYLRNNKAPRLLVIYLAPWNTGRSDNQVWVEGLIMMLRHNEWGALLHTALRDPIGLVDADAALVPLAFRYVTSRGDSAATAQKLAQQGGFLAYPFAVAPLAPGCSLLYGAPAEAGWLPREIERSIHQSSTRVLLYLAPIPDCNGSAAFASPAFAGNVGGNAAPPAVLPRTMFAGDIYQVHILAPYAPVSTALVEKAISGALHSNP